MKKLLFILSMIFLTSGLYAQEQVESEDVNKDDLGQAVSEFKESFFDALSEKAKGNYDKAISHLNKCLELQPESAAVEFEIAKNHFGNKAFAKAESSILNAINLRGRDEWLLDFLYEVYNEQKEYEKALAIMEELTAKNDIYEEFLPSLYYRLNKNDEALAVIEKLDLRLGEDDRRNRLKAVLTKKQQRQVRANGSIASLEEKIKRNPKDEQSYINLIYMHGRNNDTSAILEVAQQLEKNIPKSDAAQLALYKIYFENNQTDKGFKSLEKVLKSDQISEETKLKVLNDYIAIAGTNPDAAAGMDRAMDWISDDIDNPKAYKAMGDFHLKKNDPNQALAFYEKGLEVDATNFDLIKSAALLSIDVKDYTKTLKITNDAVELFPAQPLLYLLNGVAHNGLNQPDDAIEALETGQAYLIDEVKLETDILQQLAIAFDKKGNSKKASAYRKQIEQLLKKS